MQLQGDHLTDQEITCYMQFKDLKYPISPWIPAQNLHNFGMLKTRFVQHLTQDIMEILEPIVAGKVVDVNNIGFLSPCLEEQVEAEEGKVERLAQAPHPRWNLLHVLTGERRPREALHAA